MSDSPVSAQPPRRLARMQMINFVTDAVTLLVMLAIAGTGLLLRFVLPPGTRGGQGLQLWGLTRHEWGDIHFWLSVSVVALFVVHVALHWNWVCAIVARSLQGHSTRAEPTSTTRRSAYGAGFLLAIAALLLGFVWVAGMNTARSADDAEHGGRGYRGGRNAARVGGLDDARPATRERGRRGTSLGP